MQTFLPYLDFEKTAQCLDRYRLGKQRIEAAQILCCLGDEWALHVFNYKCGNWINHPVVRMWQGHIHLLRLYYNEILTEWHLRGYKNNMPYASFHWGGELETMPEWFNHETELKYRQILIKKQENSKVKLDRNYKEIFND